MDMTQMNVLEQFIYYIQTNGGYIFSQFWRHFLISIYGVLFASMIGIPLGIFIARHRKISDWVLGFANVINTIPSLAMMSILMLVLGLGVNTVIVTVILYSLLPIILNTYTGMINLDPGILDAAKGLGMTPAQRLRMVEIPLAFSVIMAGVRNALVLAIGIATIGAFIGAGGLGDIIIRGTNATDGGAIILAGAIPTAVMAVFVDILLGWLQNKLYNSAAVKAAQH